MERIKKGAKAFLVILISRKPFAAIRVLLYLQRNLTHPELIFPVYKLVGSEILS